MPYRDLVLHLTVGNPEGLQVGIDYAVALARQSGAHLTALFTRPRLPLAYHYIPTSVIQEHSRTMELEAQAGRERFNEAIARADVAGEWVEVQGGSLEAIHCYGRTADLVLVNQTAGCSNDPILGREYGAELLRHDVAIGLGRPVLMFPCTPKPDASSERILVGWNASKEATRAVHDAMPLLQAAKSVDVLCVGRPDEAAAKGERLVNHLTRHGVTAQLVLRSGDDAAAGEILLAEAERLNTNLIVMGAYGHVRWREVVFGGATETMLEKAPLPVLFSH
jgi:nucleotide-binding universal stress UspA family protein